jgi:hypothetical protein
MTENVNRVGVRVPWTCHLSGAKWNIFAKIFNHASSDEPPLLPSSSRYEGPYNFISFPTDLSFIMAFFSFSEITLPFIIQKIQIKKTSDEYFSDTSPNLAFLPNH